METLFFAQVIGAFSITMGLSMVVRQTMLSGIFREMSRQRTLTYIMGVMMLLMGLLLLLNYQAWQIWQEPLSYTMTALGVLIVLEALAFLFLPKKQLAKYLRLLENKKVYYLIAAAYLLLGGYLVYFGFLFGVAL